MTRKIFYLVPLILTAACSHNDTGTVAAAAAPEAVAPAPPVPEAAPGPIDVVHPTPAPPWLPSGTVLRVRLDETVDTKRNQPGDVVHATLSQPVVVAGRTVLPAGTRFTGHVSTADPSGRLKGRAYIGVKLDSFQSHGRTYRVSTTSVDRASKAHKKRNGILIGGAAGLGAAIGAIAGGAKGALIGGGAGAGAGTAGAAITGKLHVAIPAETPLRFTVRSPVRS